MMDKSEDTWQFPPTSLDGEQALTAAVVAAHHEVLTGQLQGDPMLNPAIGIEPRSFRELDDWRVLLLLTPWMLARLLFPSSPPSVAIPNTWSAAARRDADYIVLGPQVRFELLGQPQKAHLNYHPTLGHYLIQPLCLDLSSYRDAESVFAAWNQVIQTRDANMEKTKRDCPMQREISRRELFAGLPIEKPASTNGGK